VVALVVLVIFERRHAGTPFTGEGGFVRIGRLIFGAGTENGFFPPMCPKSAPESLSAQGGAGVGGGVAAVAAAGLAALGATVVRTRTETVGAFFIACLDSSVSKVRISVVRDAVSSSANAMKIPSADLLAP